MKPSSYVGELNDFARAETKLFVVIQDSVQVLNPHSIHWPVKHVPLFLLVHRCYALANKT